MYGGSVPGDCGLEFKEMPENWFRTAQDNDKIVDAVSGCHYVAVITESGRLICSGYRLYREFGSLA